MNLKLTGNKQFIFMLFWFTLACSSASRAQAVGRSDRVGVARAASPPTMTGAENTPSPIPIRRTPSPEDENPRPASAAPGALLRNFAGDQESIWTSPFKARIKDMNWLVPIAGVTAGL